MVASSKSPHTPQRHRGVRSPCGLFIVHRPPRPENRSLPTARSMVAELEARSHDGLDAPAYLVPLSCPGNVVTRGVEPDPVEARVDRDVEHVLVVADAEVHVARIPPRMPGPGLGLAGLDVGD